MRRAVVLALLVACRSKTGAPDRTALDTEAQVQLGRLAKQLKAHWHATAAFPAGATGPLPAAPCCRDADGLCPVSAAWRADRLWTALGFEVLDRGHLQYAYASDGHTATATAIADLDCDGTAITYTLRLTVRDGVPHAALDQPRFEAD